LVVGMNIVLTDPFTVISLALIALLFVFLPIEEPPRVVLIVGAAAKIAGLIVLNGTAFGLRAVALLLGRLPTLWLRLRAWLRRR
jgi:hypothetical protein